MYALCVAIKDNFALFWINHLLNIVDEGTLNDSKNIETKSNKEKKFMTTTKVTFGRSTTSSSICKKQTDNRTNRSNPIIKYVQKKINSTNNLDRRFRHSKCEKEITEAQMKLIRRLQYSREVASTGKDFLSLQVDSITRVVVQSFRKLINCERCSLFLMDHYKDELYFKPIGNGNGDGVKAIRFPLTKGIAGWVAINKKTVNIKDAYEDPRFFKEIDQRTNFRTKSVLCMPIISTSIGSNHLLGVVQMLNKIEPQKIELKTKTNNVKKEKSEIITVAKEGFTEKDIATMERCCEEVSKALDEIDQNKTHQYSREVNVELGKGFHLQSLKDEGNGTTISANSEENETLRKSERKFSTSRRRSSIASLVQFVNSETPQSPDQLRDQSYQGKGVSEALSKFQFRKTSGQQITPKGQMQGDATFAAAAYKRKRMTEYTKRRTNDGNQHDLALSVSLWNITTKFKSLMNADASRIFFLEADKEFCFACDQPSSRFPVSHGVIGAVLSLQEKVLINDTNKDTRARESFEVLSGTRPKCICCQPFFSEEKNAIGVIEVSSEKTFAFNEKQLKRLEFYAQKASLAFTTIREDMLTRRMNANEKISAIPKISEVATYHVGKINEITSDMTTEIQNEEQRIKKEMKRNSVMEMTANEAAARFQFRSNDIFKRSSTSFIGQKAPQSSKNWEAFNKLFNDG